MEVSNDVCVVSSEVKLDSITVIEDWLLVVALEEAVKVGKKVGVMKLLKSVGTVKLMVEEVLGRDIEVDPLPPETSQVSVDESAKSCVQ